MKYIDVKKRKIVVDHLHRVLADSFVLYYKTHAYHWNVEGIHFKSLHDLFMAQYTALWNALDELAERIRALDSYAPISIEALMSESKLQETGQLRDAKQMVKDLADDHETIAVTIAKALNTAADAGDQVTTDLMIARLQEHEKAAWMLRSLAK